MAKLLAGAASDTGRVREHNEDEVRLAEPELAQDDAHGFLFAVADGMGGHERGEVASNLAITALFETFYAEDGDDGEHPDAVTALQRAFKAANERILEEAVGSVGGGSMGTTMVAGVIAGNNLTVANVGDSRAYLVRAEAATQITRDHSLVAEQVAGGVMTPEEAKTSNYRNIITRALGHRPKVEVDVFEISLLPEDRVVLCSDGVHGSVEPEEIAALALQYPPEEASQKMIDLAMEQGSTDNVSAAVVTYEPATAAVEAIPAPAAADGRRGSPVAVLVVLVIAIAVILALVYVLAGQQLGIR